MSVRVYRGLMNILMFAVTAYWVLVLHQLIFDGIAVVSTQLRLDGYLLLFLGIVLAITGMVKTDDWGKDELAKFTTLEVTYWVINCVAFVFVFFIGAIS